MGSARTRTRRASRALALLEGWGEDITGVQSAYYGVRGEWYQAPRSYPTILVWPHGFVRFETEHELRDREGVRLTKRVNVRKGGIATLKGYVRKGGGK